MKEKKGMQCKESKDTNRKKEKRREKKRREKNKKEEKRREKKEIRDGKNENSRRKAAWSKAMPAQMRRSDPKQSPHHPTPRCPSPA